MYTEWNVVNLWKAHFNSYFFRYSASKRNQWWFTDTDTCTGWHIATFRFDIKKHDVALTPIRLTYHVLLRSAQCPSTSMNTYFTMSTDIVRFSMEHRVFFDIKSKGLGATLYSTFQLWSTVPQFLGERALHFDDERGECPSSDSRCDCVESSGSDVIHSNHPSFCNHGAEHLTWLPWTSILRLSIGYDILEWTPTSHSPSLVQSIQNLTTHDLFICYDSSKTSVLHPLMFAWFFLIFSAPEERSFSKLFLPLVRWEFPKWFHF